MPVPACQPGEPVYLCRPSRPIHKSKNSRTPKHSSQIQVTNPSSAHTQQHKSNAVSQKPSSVHHTYTNHSHLGSHRRWIDCCAPPSDFARTLHRPAVEQEGGQEERKGRGAAAGRGGEGRGAVVRRGREQCREGTG